MSKDAWIYKWKKYKEEKKLKKKKEKEKEIPEWWKEFDDRRNKRNRKSS